MGFYNSFEWQFSLLEYIHKYSRYEQDVYREYVLIHLPTFNYSITGENILFY